MNQPLRLLLLEDLAADAELALHALRGEGFQLDARRVWTETDFRAALREPTWDLILADYALPSYDGVSALQLAQQERPEIPFIFVSGTLGEETAVDVLHHGATDCVMKQRLGRLGPAVRRALRASEIVRERLRAEQELHSSRMELGAIYDHAPIVMCLLDQHLRVVRANRAAAQFSGRSQQALIGQRCGDVLGCLHVQDDPCGCGAGQDCQECLLRQATQDTLETGRTHVGVEANPTLARGTRAQSVWVIAHTARFEIEGQPRVLLCIEDVTTRRQAEQALRDAESLFHSLVEHLPQCVFRKDRAGRITYANKLFCTLLGRTLDEVIGKTDLDLCPPELAEKYRQDDQRVMETQEIFHDVEENQPPGKSKIVVQVLKAPVHNASGEVIGLQGIVLDITGQKVLEAKFLRAQRLESVGNLVSGIAHDLNNILAPIFMCAPMLRTPLPEEDRQEIISTIEASARRAEAVVKQLLSFGCGKDGEKAVLQFGPLLQEMVKIVRETFPRALEVTLEAPSDLWPIKANHTHLHQVLLNLCVNARDAMPQGGQLALRARNVFLDEHFVSMHSEARLGPHLHLQVSDTGCGIPDDLRDRIFEPLFTTKNPDKGTGLGLTTVLGIVKDHAGFIRVTSVLGQGTTFEIYLPALPLHQVAVEPPPARHAVPGAHGELVLIVDDEPPILAVTARTLTQHGYQVLRASDGVDGLAQFTQRGDAVRAVVTDLMMPLMDGTTLCRLLRRLSPATPILVSTGVLEGQAGQTLRKTLTDLGVRHILQKPYTADTLLRALHQALTEAQPPDLSRSGRPVPALTL